MPPRSASSASLLSSASRTSSISSSQLDKPLETTKIERGGVIFVARVDARHRRRCRNGPSTREVVVQPETRLVTESQLIPEVKSIYAGLVMVENKCAEIDAQQMASSAPLSAEQWSALSAVHRTLMHEHHDFFLASLHPSATARLRCLPRNYDLPNRLWRHGIHGYLELLRSRLPESREYMLAFIYTAYSMLTLLVETVVDFTDTWIECLGDTARYRMAVETRDIEARDHWAGVARRWYRLAADRLPGHGRIHHHVAILVRPDRLAQLFYYTKSLVCDEPYHCSDDSICLLFDPLLSAPEPQLSREQEKERERDPARDMSIVNLIKAIGALFRRLPLARCHLYSLNFLDGLPRFVGRSGQRFRQIGMYMASACVASLLLTQPDFATSDDWVYQDGQQHERTMAAAMLAMETFAVFLRQTREPSVMPAIHVFFAFLSTASTQVLRALEPLVPFPEIHDFLTSLSDEELGCASPFDKYLPEDFDLRGCAWADGYFPENFFDDELHDIPDEEARRSESAAVMLHRAQRCAHMANYLSSMDTWQAYGDGDNDGDGDGDGDGDDDRKPNLDRTDYYDEAADAIGRRRLY